MADWIASGRVLDVILVGMALEGAFLTALWRASRRGIAPGNLLPNLGSGMCLLLAMRVGLAGGWWGWVSLPLLGALVLHLTDLRFSWTPGFRPSPSRKGQGEGSPVVEKHR